MESSFQNNMGGNSNGFNKQNQFNNNNNNNNMNNNNKKTPNPQNFKIVKCVNFENCNKP